MGPIDLVEELHVQPAVAQWIVRLEAATRSGIERCIDLRPPYDEPKAIKDSVWGMIDLEGREATVVDSPPLQRLRRIKQMGASFLTYPTAGYSRFEHALGAMHQAERMVRAVIRRSPDNLRIEIESSLPTVRLAALLHDVGHLPLSHVCERFYSRAECTDSALLAEVAQVKRSFASVLKVSPSLAECLSLLVITAPAMRRFLVDHVGYSWEDVATAALAIVGRPPSGRRVFVMQLVTNAIDADKLDYMFRDSRVTGVPIGIDLDRLLYKLFCLEVSGPTMPTAMKRLFPAGERAIVLGTDLSGFQLAYDLAAARSILFERIYLHHKTRSAERVVNALMNRRRPHPVDLVSEDDGWFGQYSANANDREVLCLTNRELPNRAFAMSREYLLSQAQATDGRVALEPATDRGWKRLHDALNDADSRDTLRTAIATRATQWSRILGRKPVRPSDVWMEPPPPRYEVQSAELLVRRPDGTVGIESGFAARASSHTINPSDTVYVFATHGSGHQRDLVHAAAEAVISERFGVWFGRDAADYSKISTEAVDELKRAIEAARPRVFETDGRLRPRGRWVRTGEGSERVGALAQRFHEYQGAGDIAIDADRIVSFLDQFSEALAEPAVVMLEKLRFYDARSLRVDFVDFVKSTTEDPAATIPLTPRMGKSSSLLSYYVRALNRQPSSIGTISEALQGSTGRLCLFDDFLLSGFQAVTTFERMLGLPPTTDDVVADALPPSLADVLRRRPLDLRFALAHPVGIARLTRFLSGQGIVHSVQAMDTVDGKRTDLALAVGPAYRPLRGFLRTVGYSLLKSSKARANPNKWTDAVCRQRSLGYGGAEILAASFYNTPSGAITPLWKTGQFRGAPWCPLLPRLETDGTAYQTD